MFALLVAELMVGANDEAVVGVVFHEAAHVGAGGEIGVGGDVGDVKRGKAAPIIERVIEFFEPNFLMEKDLFLKRNFGAASEVTPGFDFTVLDDVAEVFGVEDQHASQAAAITSRVDERRRGGGSGA